MTIVKKIGPWIISAALCLLALEILGAAVCYWNKKSLVYLDRPTQIVAQSATAPTYKQRLHPYFGYTGPYSLQGPAYTNNLGFPQVQARQVPFQPEPNDFVVVVFGGSVASNLVSPPRGGMRLQQALQGLPQLAGKNVVIYSMAQGPGKQPQQLMELAFLTAIGQHIDFVLNLDGTLEFVSSLGNFQFGVDPIFPPVDSLGAIGNELAPIDTGSEDYYALAYGVTHARAETKRYASLLDRSRSGVAYLKNMIFGAFYERSLREKLKAYSETVAKAKGWEASRRLLGLDMPVRIPKEKIIEYSFDIWLRCSDLMKAMANSTGATYLNIVHPNPWHSQKVLTEAEKAVLILPESNAVRQGSSAGHAFIEDHAEMLQSRGIISGMTLFDNTTDTVFIDSGGHLSKLGETMLAEFVAGQMEKRIESPQGKEPGSSHNRGGSVTR